MTYTQATISYHINAKEGQGCWDARYFEPDRGTRSKVDTEITQSNGK